MASEQASSDASLPRQHRDYDVEAGSNSSLAHGPVRENKDSENSYEDKQETLHDKGPSVEPADETIVWWNEPADEDPENPMNWSNKKKWANIGTLSMITFLTPLASSMFAPGVPVMLAEFHTSSTIFATFVVSVFVLGFAFGPLLLAPMSEMYGRTIVYHSCNVFFVIFTIACAVAKTQAQIIIFRFLAGFAGVAVVTCGSGSIADLMPRERRGSAMALWSLGPLLGPIVGPVAGGFLVEAKGWRWVFWLIAIVSGAVTLVSFLVLNETYAPILLERKAARLRKETGNPKYRSKLASGLSEKEQLKRAIVRPMKMLFLSPIVAAMCTYIATMYGLLYILFTTFTFVYEEIYHFSSRGAGLSFISSGIGTLMGLAYAGKFSDWLIRRKMAHGKEIGPEDRLDLRMTIPFALTLPSGLLIYGWTADKHVHWIAPMIGTGIMGFGMIGILMCIQTYLVDAFTMHAASVTAANAVVRSLLGALLPLCGLDMYDRLGIGWGNTLLALIAYSLAPVPWLLALYGAKIRTNPKWQVNL